MYQTVSTESSSLESRYTEIAAQHDETQTDMQHYQRQLQSLQHQLQQTQAQLAMKERDTRDLNSRVANMGNAMAEAQRSAQTLEVEKTLLENQMQMSVEENEG